MKEGKIIGLQRKKVKLLSYNKKWKELYEKEEKLLRSVLGSYIKDIQHVGSTSMPEAEAKPIIDIAVGVESLKIGEKCIKLLEKLGYEYKHDTNIKERHFFTKGSEKNRTHYLSVEKINGKTWKNHVLFRDYLRKHKEALREYNELKKRLAKKYKNNRDAYTLEKGSFIQKILKK